MFMCMYYVKSYSAFLEGKDSEFAEATVYMDPYSGALTACQTFDTGLELFPQDATAFVKLKRLRDSKRFSRSQEIPVLSRSCSTLGTP